MLYFLSWQGLLDLNWGSRILQNFRNYAFRKLFYPTFFSFSPSSLTSWIDWKFLSQTEIFAWDVIKIDLFFDIVPLAVHALPRSVLLCLNATGPKNHRQQIWRHYKNFSAYELFSLPSSTSKFMLHFSFIVPDIFFLCIFVTVLSHLIHNAFIFHCRRRVWTSFV